MRIDEAAGEAVEERRAAQLHEAGADHQVGGVGGAGLGEGGVPVGPLGEVAEPHDEGGDAGPLGTGQALDAGRSAPTATTSS